LVEKILELAEEPFRGKPLHGEAERQILVSCGKLQGCLHGGGNTVYLLAVGHRKKIYERLERG
jgi:mRNA-degrading endonuclease RelE of RelBE toxin-antitoxin system